MTNSLQIFDFSNQPVRVALIDGEPWFVAKDVCDVLGISNSRDALSRLDDDEKGVGFTDTLGGRQEIATVNESGLYLLIFRSRKRAARDFRRWVTHEVLPQIRKTGRYEPPIPAPTQRELFPELDSEDLARLTRVLHTAYRLGAITKVEVAREMRGLLIGAGFALEELSPEIEEMDEWVHRIAPLLTDDLEFITAAEVVQAIDEPNHKKNVMRAAECLKQLGWRPARLRRRIPGRRRLEQFRGFVRGEEVQQ